MRTARLACNPEGILDVRLDQLGLNVRRVSVDHLALLVDEEFGKVPLKDIG